MGQLAASPAQPPWVTRDLGGETEAPLRPPGSRQTAERRRLTPFQVSPGPGECPPGPWWPGALSLRTQRSQRSGAGLLQQPHAGQRALQSPAWPL